LFLTIQLFSPVFTQSAKFQYSVVNHFDLPKGYVFELNYAWPAFIASTNTIFAMTTKNSSKCQNSGYLDTPCGYLLPISASTGKLLAAPIVFVDLAYSSKGYAYDPENSKLFIAQVQRVAVISTKTDKLLANLTAPGGTARAPISGMSYDPHNDELYVSNGYYVDAFNAATDSFVSKINTIPSSTVKSMGEVSTVVYDSTKDQIYASVLNFNSSPEAYIVTISDSTNKIIGTISTPNAAPETPAVPDPSSHLLYVADAEGAIDVYNTSMNHFIGRTPLDLNLTESYIPSYFVGNGNAYGNYIFASSDIFADNGVIHIYAIDKTMASIVATAVFPPHNYSCEATFSSPALGVSFLSCSQSLFVLSDSSGSVLASIPNPRHITGADLYTIGYSPKSGLVYAVEEGFNEIYEIST
jgi:hypothetical protein